MNERAKALSRRRFLLAAGSGGALAAAAIAARSPGSVRPALREKDRRATRGYQASEHVDHYYRTAKV